MLRKRARLALVFSLLMLLSACGPKETAVIPTPQPTPSPTLSTSLPSPSPTPSPTPPPGPEPVCLLQGEEIVSLCGTAFSHDAMLTAEGKLLV